MKYPCLLLLAFLLALEPSHAQSWFIDTVAGGGPPDGVPGDSTYFDIRDIAVDAEGNIYFPSRQDHRIYMIDSSGIVHHVAGTGIEKPLGDGGPAERASFLLPTSLVLTPDDDLIVYEGADFGTIFDMPPPPLARASLRLRRIDGSTGLVSTIPSPQELSLPWDLILGPSGDLILGGYMIGYTEDRRDDIRRFDPVSGEMVPVAAYYGRSSGLAIDQSGHLFASDSTASIVRSIDLESGTVDTYAGNGTAGDSGDGGSAIEAEVTPRGLIVNSEGNLYIAALGRVRMVDAETGIIETVAGNGVFDTTGDGGPATAASVKAEDLGFDAEENLYISGCSSGSLLSLGCDVRKVDAATGIITTIARTAFVPPFGDDGPATEARLGNPQDLALAPNGDLYIMDSGFTAIWKVDGATGTVDILFMEEPTGAGRNLADPPSLGGIALDPNGGVHYSTYHTSGGLPGIYGRSSVWRLDPQEGPVLVAGDWRQGYDGNGGPAIDALLSTPSGLAFDTDGNLFIADSGNKVIRRVDAATGIIDTYAGGGTPGELGDGGPATEASLIRPVSLAIDDLGNLFIGDRWDYRVRRVDAVTGIIETVAGNGELGFTGDGGPATDASITVAHIALDREGNLYISGSQRIRKVSAATGLIHTIAGDGVLDFYGDGGPALEAALGGPRGMAIDEDGKLLVAAYHARRVRRLQPPPELRVTATPSVLPRSHELVAIELSVEGAGDFVPVEIRLDSVVSSEPDDAPGGSDGHTIGDIQDASIGEADFSILLRAERDARGGLGRVYTIRYVGVDAVGREGAGEARVVVPHSGPRPR